MTEREVRVHQRLKIIRLLQERGEEGAINLELNEIALRYTSHISELRSEGFVINCKNEGGGVFRYTLEHIPVFPAAPVSALETFYKAVEGLGGVVTKEEIEGILNAHSLNVVKNWGSQK